MRVFVAGATGAIGRRLVPLLVEHGHVVTATTRSAAKAADLTSMGAEAAVVDVLDAAATTEAVVSAKPDVVIHQATALSGSFDFKHMDQFFALTNQLRTTGTDNILAAACAAGAERVIAQSYTGWPNARSGPAVQSEDDPRETEPPAAARQTMAALRYVDTVVPEAADLTGVVLRYGGFYGPGTSLGAGGEVPELVRKRRVPIVGDGGGIWSFLHVDDAASATLAAIDHGSAGVYNVVDDDPAPVAEWLPALAAALGAPAPRRVPTWLGRLAIGENSVRMMTQIRGSSNAKAKRELGWSPQWPSWREGFRNALG